MKNVCEGKKNGVIRKVITGSISHGFSKIYSKEIIDRNRNTISTFV